MGPWSTLERRLRDLPDPALGVRADRADAGPRLSAARPDRAAPHAPD